MKKIIKASAFLGLIFGSVNLFASDIVGPQHRLEGTLTLAKRFDKKNRINKFKDDNIETNGNEGVNWTEYNSISLSYRPEWTIPLNDLLSITLGPSVNFGTQLNIDLDNSGPKSRYGFEGGFGAELDLNFQIPNSEVIYIGLDYVFKGIGYIDFAKDDKTLLKGFQTGVGLSVGGKVSNKIKLGLRLGYEYTQLWNGSLLDENQGKKNKMLVGQHVMPISVTFGYILGD